MTNVEKNKSKLIINSSSSAITDWKFLAGVFADSKFVKVFKIGKNSFWFYSKTGYCFFCTDRTLKKQGNFCNRYCQGFYENWESHYKLRMNSWLQKEEREYDLAESNLLEKVVKVIPGEVWRAKKGLLSLHDIYTEEEWREKPLNDQRLRIIRKIHAHIVKKSKEFLYCFALGCFKPFEVTSQPFRLFSVVKAA